MGQKRLGEDIIPLEACVFTCLPHSVELKKALPTRAAFPPCPVHCPPLGSLASAFPSSLTALLPASPIHPFSCCWSSHLSSIHLFLCLFLLAPLSVCVFIPSLYFPFCAHAHVTHRCMQFTIPHRHSHTWKHVHFSMCVHIMHTCTHVIIHNYIPSIINNRTQHT